MPNTSAPTEDAPKASWLSILFTALVTIYGPVAFSAWFADGLPIHDELGGFWTKLAWTLLGTLVCLPAYGLLFLLLRRLFAAMFFWMFVLLYTPVLVWGLASTINVRYDISPAEVVYFRFVEHHAPSKGNSYDTFAFEDDPTNIVYSYYKVDTVDRVPGRRLQAERHTGYLGIAWFTKLRAAEAVPSSQ